MANKGLSVEIAQTLDAYAKEVRDEARDTIDQTAKDTAKKLKDTSPKDTGRYAKGWSVKKDRDGATVYNKTAPQLTHLLENGHAKVNGGRVPGEKHIEPAQEWAEDELTRRIERNL